MTVYLESTRETSQEKQICAMLISLPIVVTTYQMVFWSMMFIKCSTLYFNDFKYTYDISKCIKTVFTFIKLFGRI